MRCTNHAGTTRRQISISLSPCLSLTHTHSGKICIRSSLHLIQYALGYGRGGRKSGYNTITVQRAGRYGGNGYHGLKTVHLSSFSREQPFAIQHAAHDADSRVNDSFCLVRLGFYSSLTNHANKERRQEQAGSHTWSNH